MFMNFCRSALTRAAVFDGMIEWSVELLEHADIATAAAIEAAIIRVACGRTRRALNLKTREDLLDIISFPIYFR
ncbi:hypothetical protein [Streptomyces sp. NPDC046976]|uniref:hypothetical protein n=1 Tax=Streptomyces sp. NPDC046976 TaxID=3155258 RepID=UPI0033C68529